MKSFSFPGRKDTIILTAIDIISDSGIQGLSTKELAKRQDITESLLYRYFRSKDDIIVAVLEYYAEYDLSIIETIRNSPLDSKAKIMEFIRMYMEYYENYPAITAIQHSAHQLMIDPQTGAMVRDVLYKRDAFVRDLIEKGQVSQEINRTFSALELTDIIISLTRNSTLTWRMEGFSFSLKDRVLPTLEKLLALC